MLRSAIPAPPHGIKTEVGQVGARIRAARERAGFSRRQVADWLGVSYQRLADIEADRKPTTLEVVLRVAEAIACDPHTLDARLASTRPKPKDARSNQ